MRKSLVSILAVIALVLLLLVAGASGYIWYRESHIFVEGIAYSVNAHSLDLRNQTISLAHYNTLHAQLPDCQIFWNVPFQGSRIPNTTRQLTVKQFTQEDMDFIMSYFPPLTTLDAEGCQDYALLEAFQEANPQCEVRYSVDIGGSKVSPDVTALDLHTGEYDLDVLIQRLPYLKNISKIHFPTPNLTREQIASLRAADEALTVTYTVEFLGQEYDPETTTQLDLSQLTSQEVELAAGQLENLYNLSFIELTGDSGSSLSKEDARTLTLAAPQADFHYSFDFYGETLSSSDTEVHIKQKKIGDEGEAEIRMALDLLPKVERFVLEYCNVSNDVMAAIRDDYRERTKVVWRVQFGNGGSSLTDATAMRVVGGLVDDNCHDLVYCEDVVFLDIGHNEYLDAVPFIEGMPKLEYVIISGAPVKSLEPFRVCKNLRFLEAAFCEYIYDASPLAECESLEMLNISYSHITDLRPLDDLEHLHTLFVMYEGRSRVPWDEQQRFISLHPDCRTEFVGKQPYGIGWRYATTTTFLPDYQLIRDIFNYDAFPGPGCPNDTGFYYDTELYENRRNLE